MPSYYLSEDLARFGDIAKTNPKLFDLFLKWYSETMEPAALDAKTKKLIAYAVANAIQEPYCIDSYASACPHLRVAVLQEAGSCEHHRRWVAVEQHHHPAIGPAVHAVRQHIRSIPQRGRFNRPDVVGNPHANVPPGLAFNRAVFRLPALGTFGNSGRNVTRFRQNGGNSTKKRLKSIRGRKRNTSFGARRGKSSSRPHRRKGTRRLTDRKTNRKNRSCGG